MRQIMLFCSLALVATGAALAQVYRPAFDPGRLKGPRTGPMTELLVLGTPHLSSLPDTFVTAGLTPVLDRLAHWRPQAIAIEAVPGEQCDFMRRYPDRYRSSVESYCWDTAPAKVATGLDIPAAVEEAERLLTRLSAVPTGPERRRLAATFLAAGNSVSALVQWLKLPETERHAGDGLDAVLVARLNVLMTRRNENSSIAAPLAVRLGLERVYPVDDHTADAPSSDEKAYGAAIAKAWDNPVVAKRKKMDAALEAKANTPDGVLVMYRAYNAPSSAQIAYDSDFGAALREPSPQRFGRNYVGYWETRNLRMASNIRDMLGQRPGIRALMIVGVSHKGYLDAYLNQMHDVRIVDAERVLR